MNNDLISRKELKDFIKEVCFSEKWVKFRLNNGSIGQIKIILAYIDSAPAVDVKPFANVTFNKDELEQIVKDKVIEPIKNGELVIKKESSRGEWITDERGYVCSECGALHSDDYPFCHMCGADMRKEASDV